MPLLNSPNPIILRMLTWRPLNVPYSIQPVSHVHGFVVLVPRIFYSSLSDPALPSADSSVPYPSEGLYIDSGHDRAARMGRRCFGCILPASLYPVHPFLNLSLPSAQLCSVVMCPMGGGFVRVLELGAWVEPGRATASLIQGSLGECL